MPTIYMTVGLPGSGKSTWAMGYARESRGQVLETSKDHIRPLAPEGLGRKEVEKWTITAQDQAVRTALEAGKSIVVHDTNLNPYHFERFTKIAQEHGGQVELVDFTHIGVEECVRRDARRTGTARVGREVIESMHAQWLQ